MSLGGAAEAGVPHAGGRGSQCPGHRSPREDPEESHLSTAAFIFNNLIIKFNIIKFNNNLIISCVLK